MPAVSNQTMLETIEEGLNEVFWEKYFEGDNPDIALLSDVFMESDSKKATEMDLDLKGTGKFNERGEEEDLYEDIVKEKYKTYYKHSEFADSVPLTKVYIEDELYGIVKDLVIDLAHSAKYTQYDNAFSIFRNGFNVSYPGADGQPLFSATHPRDFGGTLNNLFTEKFKASVLQEMIASLLVQPTHSNKLAMGAPKILLVPPPRYAQAVEITDAKLVPGSNNNEPNVVYTKYSLIVKQSPHLSSVVGGNDNAVFLLASRHKVKRYIRVPLQTWMTDWKQSAKIVTKYCARYRESVGWSSPVGVVATNGTTGSY